MPTTAAQGYEQATTSGPNFSSGPAQGTVFALTQSTLALSQSGSTQNVTADTTTDNAGATITDVNSTTKQVEVKIPGLSIDATFTFSQGGGSASVGSNSTLNFQTVKSANLTYTEFGTWDVANSTTQNSTSISYFIFGYQTPPTSMPTSGTATYSGTGAAEGSVGLNGTTNSGKVVGDVSITANFGTGSVNGTLSNMMLTPSGGGTAVPWDTVSLSGTIAGASISGTTAVTSSPGNAYALTTGATGTLRGNFYGPTANEIGAIWTLKDTNGSAAIGSLGVAMAPSDRRLKRDVREEGRLDNGLALYSYAYLGDKRRFLGVMAQDVAADPDLADAVVADSDGLMRVDYGRLGFVPTDLAGMVEAGERAMALVRSAA